MRDPRKPSSLLATFLIVLGLLGLGCAPKEEGDGAQDVQPSPTPPGIPFVVHTDAEEAHFLILKPHLEKTLHLPENYYVRWNRSESPPDRWDVALVRTWNLDEIEPAAVDLAAALDAAYPRHGSDFFVPTDSLQLDGRLLSLPVVLIPDFLFARGQPGWNLRFDETTFQAELDGGAKIGMLENPAGEFYRRRLGLSDDQVVSIDFGNPNNPFFLGEIDFAIGPKGWLVEKQIQGLSTVSTAQLGLPNAVPDGGYRFAIANDSPEVEAAFGILRNFVTDGQSALVGMADAFPIRRSVYSSPRMQTPQFALFRIAFEETLGNLAPRFPTD